MADIYPDIKTWLQEKSIDTHASDYVLSPERRTESLRAVAENNFPTRKDEEWRYTPIANVVNRSIQSGTDLSIDADDLQEIKQIVP
ncbi:MAG: hypothetical protein K9M49_04065, partial [Candidatus Marinimicrobia bacterium]|nr:hypothetical protein [Candidatus Neomarinimicrobiota bacterium]